MLITVTNGTFYTHKSISNSGFSKHTLLLKVMDNSISDDNINTVAAAAVIAASTATSAVGTPTITKSNDGSQSGYDNDGQINAHDDNEKNNCEKTFSMSGATCISDEHKSREFSLRRNDGSYKRITSKCISRARDLVHKCQSDPGGSRVSTALNVNANRSSQTRSSLRHQSPSSSTSASASATATTRKCVLTLDGYNYVIGKLRSNQFVQFQCGFLLNIKSTQFYFRHNFKLRCLVFFIQTP